MLLGVLPLAGFLVALSLYSLSRLDNLNLLNQTIVTTDVPVLEITGKMRENLLSQELYRRRYLILGGIDMLRIFWRRSDDFQGLVRDLRKLPQSRDLGIDRLNSAHDEYNQLAMTQFRLLKDEGAEAAKAYDKDIQDKHSQLLRLTKDLGLKVQQAHYDKLAEAARMGLDAYRVTALLCAAGILLGIGASLLMTRNISRSVHELKIATERIAAGDYSYTPAVHQSDELGELARAFQTMARRVKRSEELYLDASPLTRLPGNVAIENLLTKRLEAGDPTAFCLADLDDFKAFNDRYGYARGSEVIKATARIVESAVEEVGEADDFVGHIGGDDFVVITTPDRYEAICRRIIEDFDRQIGDYYDPEDREAGCIRGKTRQGEIMTFPIMAISIAVVTNTVRPISCHIEVGEIAAELKECAKNRPGSNFVVDRRRRERPRLVAEKGPSAEAEVRIIDFPGRSS